VKLLFDENLSHRLVMALSDVYPGSSHLRDCGLRGASDDGVWQYARVNGFVIVSKDADFSVGNCTTTRAEFVLRNNVARLVAFESGEESCLVLKV
jgi:predicted nuclease of predicted toxin-antitoxin system